MLKISHKLKKLPDIPLPLKAAVYYAVCSFLQRGFSLISTPIYTRLMSTEEYGTYCTYLSWQNVIALLVTLNLFQALSILYSKYKGREKVLSSIASLSMCMALFWFALAVVFRRFLSNAMNLPVDMIICLFLYSLFYGVIVVWRAYKRFEYDYKSFVIQTLLLTAFNTILGVIAVVFFSATASAIVRVSTSVHFCVWLVILASIYKNSNVLYDGKIWKFALGYCLPLMPHFFSEFVLQSSDRIMINNMCGASDVAIYSIAYTIGAAIGMFTGAVNQSFEPYQFEKLDSGEYKDLARRANQVMCAVACVLFVIMFMRKEITLILGGEQYIAGADLVIPVCIGAFFNYLFQVFARVQHYYERKITISTASVLCALLNIVLNNIFIERYGYKAAAYTTFVCYLLFCFLHYLFYRRVCRQEIGGLQIYDIKSLIIISLIVIIGGIIISIISEFVILKYCLLISIAAIAVVLRKRLMAFLKQVISKE